MNLYTFSIKRPVTVTVIVLALIVISIMFSTRLNVADFPEIDVPIIAVTTTYKGAGPKEVEEQVSIKIEEAVGSVGNIERLESYSKDSVSVVIIEFHYGTDMQTAAADIREKIDKVKKDLPDGAESPVVIKANPSDSPVVRLTLTDKNNDMRRLRSIADNRVKKELEKIGGVASITVNGGIERAIVVHVDSDKLQALSIPVASVSQAITRENADVPVGRMKTGDMEFSIRSMGEIKDLKDFGDILISNVGGKSIYLKDVAKIRDSQKEVRVSNRYNGKACVTLDVRKNTDANVVVVADEVKKALKIVNKGLPEGYKLEVAYDKSIFIRQAINNLKETAIQGGILAMIIVLIFLRSLVSTVIICVSIPVSITFTFLMLYFNKLTINMITLIAFILAIGSIVDASVVVLENIFRHLEMGKEPKIAAIDGAGEVGSAVFGAVMTNVIVFFPIFLIKGLTGQIFSPLAKTMISAMLCSLASAIFIVPMLAARYLNADSLKSKNPLALKANALWDKIFENGVKLFYKKALKWCLGHRLIVVIVAFLIFISTMYMSQFIKTELQGKWDRGDFVIKIETPIGSSLEHTNKVIEDVEKYFLKNIPENKSLVIDIGQGPSGFGSGASSLEGEAPRLGGLTVSLIDADERQKRGLRSVFDVEDDIVDHFKDYPGAKIQAAQLFSISGRQPIEILIQGNNLDVLTRLSLDLKEKMSDIKGLKNLDISYRPGSPEYRVILDRKKAAGLGLSSGQVYSILRSLFEEDSISEYREEGNEYDIFIQLPEKQRNSVEKIKQLRFLTPEGKHVALSEIAKVVPEFGPSSISRRNRSRYVSVQAGLKSDVALSEVLKKIQPIIKNLKLPSGYSIVIAGEEQERGKIFGNMIQALFLAIILIYVFLAIQFESFIHPFTVMVSIPMQMTGVFGSLLLTGNSMTMFSLLGVIMLVGIVVSAAIVLIDYVIQRKEDGLPTKVAVMEASVLRLRPILMTVLTTMIAMFPLALGLKAGSAMFKGLAIVSIGGLLTSTVLTLLVIPVVYSVFEDLQDRFSKKRS